MQEPRKYVLIKKDLKEIEVLLLKEIESRLAFLDADELDEYAVFGPVEATEARLFNMEVAPYYIGLRSSDNELFDEYLAPDGEDETQI